MGQSRRLRVRQVAPRGLSSNMETKELIVLGVAGYVAYRLLTDAAAPALQDGTGPYQAPPSGTLLGNVEGVSVGPSTHSQHGRRTPRSPSNIPPGASTPAPGTGSVTPVGDTFQQTAAKTAAAQAASVSSALAQGQAVRDAGAKVAALASSGLAASSAALRKGYTYVPAPVGQTGIVTGLAKGQNPSKAFVDNANANMLASASKLDAARAARDAKVAASDAARPSLATKIAAFRQKGH